MNTIEQITETMRHCPTCNKIPEMRKNTKIRKRFCNASCRIKYMRKFGKLGYGVD